jgi:hypothetical protein
MLIFRSPDYKPLLTTTNNQLYSTINVTRYAKDSNKGLYHDKPCTDCCGTFYYYEPESSTQLAYNKESSRIYDNKFQAAADLIGIRPGGKVKRGAKTIITFNDGTSFTLTGMMKNYFKGKLKKDLRYSSTEVCSSRIIRNCPFDFGLGAGRWDGGSGGGRYGLDTENISSGDNIPTNMNLATHNNKHYLGMFLGLYASEDVFDQPICTAASKKGIDIVIFRSMVGSHQLVTEILDTRLRGVSFDHLIFAPSV